MAVNLSPVGGVAAQFFTNNGTPLTGGKIYTYAAGTTTPLATYTSAFGSTAHTNPIVLDAAGRVPNGGEVWLTDGLQYKFVLKTSTDVLIATYDNIVGINSNFVNYTNEQEIQTATAGQTVFTLTTMQYQPGTNSLSVFVDGVNQYGPGAQYAYLETDSTTVTFVSGLHVGAEVKFTTSSINASSYGDAFQISYTPPFTGSVATNVGDKIAQTVSVKDFGAVGDESADDTTAIQAALDSGAGAVYAPAGTYKITSALSINSNQTLYGDGAASIFKIYANTNALLIDGVTNVYVKNLKFAGNSNVYTANTNNAIYSPANGTGSSNVEISQVYVDDFAGAGIIVLAQSGSHSSNIRIIDNLISNTGTHGIICQDYVDDTLIALNRVENFGLAVADRPGITTGRDSARHRVLGNYVACSPSALGTSVHGISIDNCATFSCNDNVIEGAVGYGIEIGGGTIGTVVGNTIVNSTRAGIELGGSTFDVVDICVTGNVVRNAAAQGIYVQKAAGTLTERISIVGNSVYNSGQTGISVFDSSSNIIVTGNTIESCALSGLYVYKSDYLIAVSNNIRNNNTDNNAAHAGVRVINTITETNMVIDKNTVTGNGVSDFAIDNPITNKGEASAPIQVFPLATATPSIANGSVFKNSDTTAITNFTDSTFNGEMIRILAVYAGSFVNGATLKTSTGLNKTMVVDNIYTFTNVDGIWYESATV